MYNITSFPEINKWTRLYFEEIDDETESEETEDIEAAENSAYRKMEATENIAYMEIEDLEDIDDIKAAETFGEEEYREYFAHYEERKRIRLERQQRMRKTAPVEAFSVSGRAVCRHEYCRYREHIRQKRG